MKPTARRSLCGAVLSASILLWIAPTPAQTPTNIAFRATPVGEWPPTRAQPTHRVAVADGIAYALSREREQLHAFDLRDPRNPRLIGRIPVPLGSTDLDVNAGIAYVVGGGGNIRLIDVSNPVRPLELSAYTPSRAPVLVKAAGDFAFVACADGALAIVDVRNPRRPVQTRRILTAATNPADLHLSGHAAFLTSRAGGLCVIDISNPAEPIDRTAPELRSSLGQPIGIAGRGMFVFVSTADGRLVVLNFEDLSRPVRVAQIEGLGTCSQVSVHGSLACVAAGSAGVHVIDISNPYTPSRLILQNTLGTVADVQVENSIAAVANGNSGLEVLDLRDPTHPGPIPFPTPSFYAYAVAVAGTNAYVAMGPDGMAAVDVSDPSFPNTLGVCNLGFAQDIRVSGDHAYLATQQAGLKIVDVRDPRNPVVVGSRTTGDGVLALDLEGNTAFLALGIAGIAMVDVSRPSDPQRIGYFSTRSPARRVRVVDHRAYVAEGDGGFEILDVQHPDQPVYLGRYDTPGYARDVDVAGSLAWVADYEGGLQLFDVSQPQLPGPLWRKGAWENPKVVRISGSRAYANVQTNRLEVVEFDSAGRCRSWVSWVPTRVFESLAIQGSHAYLADGANGLRILNIRLGASQTLEFAPPAEVIATNPPITLQSSASSGLPVVLSVVRGPGLVVSNQLTFTGAGELVLRAEQPGNDEWLPATPVEYSLRISRARQALRWLAPTSTSLPLGTPIQLLAEASSGLPIAFRVESGPARLEGDLLSITNQGPVRISLLQPGDDRHESTQSARVFNGLPGQLSPIAVWPPTESLDGCSSVFVTGARAYLAASNTLHILDVLNPATPRQLGQARLVGPAQDVVVVGSHAYVALGKEGIDILDVEDPGGPISVARLPASPAWNVAVAASRLYSAGRESGVLKWDVSNPSQPKFVSRLGAGGTPQDVFLRDSLAYVAIGKAIEVLDLSGKPPLGSAMVPGAEAYGIHVEGNYAFVAAGVAGLQIADISRPNAPRLISSLDTPGSATRVHLAGPYVLLADGPGGLQVIDARAPEAPKALPGFSTGGEITSVHAEADLVCATDRHRGLLLLSLAGALPRMQSLGFDPPAVVSNRMDGLPLVLSAAAQSGLPVDFQLVSGPATLSSNQLIPTGRGSLVVRASQAGDATWQPVSVDREITVEGRRQTMAWVTPGTNTLTSGETYTVQALASSGLPPTYSLVRGLADLKDNQLTPTHHGTLVIRAEQAGDAWWSPASIDLSLTVVRPPITLHVRRDSPQPTPPYVTWETAARTLQDAVDAAQPSDTVLVTNGVYSDGGRPSPGSITNRVNIDKPITVRSVNGPEFTVIEGITDPSASPTNDAIRCARLVNGSTLTGFSLRHGRTGDDTPWDWATSVAGGGVWCESTSVVVSNCWILDNSAASMGGGVYGGKLVQCVVRNNTAATAGGGVYQGTLDRCVLLHNSAPEGGGAYAGVIRNSVLTANRAVSAGGGAMATDLYNCTITGNLAERGGGVAEGRVFNSIVYFNRGSGRFPNYSPIDPENPMFEHSCTTPLPTGPGNIDTLPGLLTATHLGPDSPCVGAGSAAFTSGLDQDGDSWANPPAMGADEPKPTSGPPVLLIAAATTQVVAGHPIDLVSLAGGGLREVVWDFGDGTRQTNQPCVTHAWGTAGDYVVRLIGDAPDRPGTFVATVTITVTDPERYYVDPGNSNPQFPYSSWATAANTIQDAVLAGTQRGRQVIVTNGVYASGIMAMKTWELSRVALTNEVTLLSVNGPEHTVIQGTQANEQLACVYVGNGSAISGFTLTQGRGGARCEPEGVVSNCFLLNNTVWSQGATGGGASGGILYDCVIRGNAVRGQYTLGGGAYRSTLYRCTIEDNWTSESSGGGAYGSILQDCTLRRNRSISGGGASDCDLTRCTLTLNSAGYGGGATYSLLRNCALTQNSADGVAGGAGQSTLYNCTVTRNSALAGAGGLSGGSAFNSLVYFNEAPESPNHDLGVFGEMTAFAFSCTTPLPKGPGNIDTDPQLATATHLSAASTCAAGGSGLYATGTDIDGEPWAEPPSIGADQLTPGRALGPLQPRIISDFDDVVPDTPVAFTAYNEGAILRSTWDFGEGTVETNRCYIGHRWTTAGVHTVTLTGYSDAFPQGVTTTFRVTVRPGQHFVDPSNATPAFPYTSWETAALRIQDAVAAAPQIGGTVWLTNGSYRAGTVEVNGLNRVALTNRVTLRSVNGPEVTVIEGDAADIRCAYVGPHSTLSGVTLTGGHSGSGGGALCDSSGVITNCILAHNQAYAGGGAFGGTLRGCRVTENLASYGGGVHSCRLYDCSLIGNSTVTVPGGESTYGGGANQSTLYSCLLAANASKSGGGAASSDLFNCTVSANFAEVEAGGTWSGAVVDSIVFGNYAPVDPNYSSKAWSYFKGTCTVPLPSGPGNLAADPLFVAPGRGDFHLQPDSPCVDTGLDWRQLSFEQGLRPDPLAYPREIDGNEDGVTRLDMGAYEYDPNLQRSLTATRTPSGLQLAWRPGTSGVRLQFSETLAPPQWKDVPGAENVDTFTTPMVGAAGFYRLGNASVVLGTPPSIQEQPADLTCAEREQASLSVLAVGTSPLRYRWQRLGQAGSWEDLADASRSSLVFATVQAMHAGEYRVIVANFVGSVTSRVAQLTVRTRQVLIWVSPTPGAILAEGRSYPLVVRASSGLSATFRVESGPAIVENGAVTATGLGRVVLTADQPGDASHVAASSTASFMGAGLWVEDPPGNLWGDATRSFVDILAFSARKVAGRYELTVTNAAPFPGPLELGADRSLAIIWLVDADRNLLSGQSAAGNDYNIHLFLDGSGWHWSWYKVSTFSSADGILIRPEEFRIDVLGSTATLSFPTSYLPRATFEIWATCWIEKLNPATWPPLTENPYTPRGTFIPAD